MRQSNRLAKLEADTLERWRKAWECSAVIFDKHTNGIVVDPLGLLQKLEIERPDLSSDDVEAEGVAFLESLGVTQYPAFWSWFNSWSLPEDDPPDLTRWPSGIPEPPDELPGEWNMAAPYRHSSEPVEQLAAQLYLFMLAAARAVREERSSCS